MKEFKFPLITISLGIVLFIQLIAILVFVPGSFSGLKYSHDFANKFSTALIFGNTNTESVEETEFLAQNNSFGEVLGVQAETIERSSSINKDVFASLNIRSKGKEVTMDASLIQKIFGDNNSIVEAAQYLEQNGKVEIKKYLQSILDTNETRIFQDNKEGDVKEFNGFYYYEADYVLDIDQTVEKIYLILLSRIQNNQGEFLIIDVATVYAPGSRGEFMKTGKYIEHDVSAQRMYAWSDGKLWGSWSTSGVRDPYVINGVFSIKNKYKKSWAKSVQKWMPYWMAYHYDQTQEAWFGIHGLLYWYDVNGDMQLEPSSNIGRRLSAGCIRLDRGEMDKLYEWTDVGTLFIIHD